MVKIQITFNDQKKLWEAKADDIGFILTSPTYADLTSQLPYEYYRKVQEERKIEYENDRKRYSEAMIEIKTYISKWKFPCASFYMQCKKNNIDLSGPNIDEYSIKSAQRLADMYVPVSILGGTGGYNPNKVADYYREGFLIASEVKQGYLSDEADLRKYKQGIEYRNCDPLTKRRKMVVSRIDELRKIVKDDRDRWEARHKKMGDMILSILRSRVTGGYHMGI
ncbi:MAG: hypothetical protein K6E63_06710 [Lachnospiraceae bacterium]|nr:hypothetical protein [Lachnospiraceae bacterium]